MLPKNKMLFLSGNDAVFKSLGQYGAAVCSQSDGLGICTESPVTSLHQFNQGHRV